MWPQSLAGHRSARTHSYSHLHAGSAKAKDARFYNSFLFNINNPWPVTVLFNSLARLLAHLQVIQWSFLIGIELSNWNWWMRRNVTKYAIRTNKQTLCANTSTVYIYILYIYVYLCIVQNKKITRKIIK